MRYGFTTGSCAAAASKAATYMLLTGREKTEITIETPKGVSYTTKILDICLEEISVSCAVLKDGGDDPDITTGAFVYARVSYGNTSWGSIGCESNRVQQIEIDGGTGVGRVTKPGLDQPVGNAAINSVPRMMIEKEVKEVCEILDYKGGLRVEISVPKGVELAEQTFNPRLGIVGGISILGTSGIVEPMSSQALLDTIRVELKQRKALGYNDVVISPGNYGRDFMKSTYGYDLDKSVKCSNFIGETIDMIADMGFHKVLLVGHMGKLIKVAGGIMNTHSREADCRMELLAAFSIQECVDAKLVREMMNCVTTEDAVMMLMKSEKMQQVMDKITDRIIYYLGKRAKGKLVIDCIIYTNELGELSKSKEAGKWFTL